MTLPEWHWADRQEIRPRTWSEVTDIYTAGINNSGLSAGTGHVDTNKKQNSRKVHGLLKHRKGTFGKFQMAGLPSELPGGLFHEPPGGNNNNIRMVFKEPY